MFSGKGFINSLATMASRRAKPSSVARAIVKKLTLDKILLVCYTVYRKRKGNKKMSYDLIDDPLCELDETIGAYENCEECPYFYDCMEVKDAD